MKSKGKKIAGVIGGILLAVVIVFGILCAIYHNATRMVWYNLTDRQTEVPVSSEWNGGEIYSKVPYSDISEADYVDIYVPSNVVKPPLLVFIHGGGFMYDDSQSRPSRQVIRYFRDQGYAVASVNYRLAQEAKFPAAVQDVKACIRFLRANAGTYGYSAGRIAVMGESAGGYLACMAAATSDEEFSDLPFLGEDELEAPVSAEVQVLVDYYGAVELGGDKTVDWAESHVPSVVTDIANSWLDGDILGEFTDCESFFAGKEFSEMTEEEAAYYQPITYMQENWREGCDKHVYIGHGDCDITVPLQQSERLYAQIVDQIGEDAVKFRVTPNAGHAAYSMYSDEELEIVNNYLQQWLYGMAYLVD